MTQASNNKGDRIAKFIARAGTCSRREAEKLIAEGKVEVDGVLVNSPVMHVTDDNRITIDGQPIKPIEKTRLWAHYKPYGVISTHDKQESRPTIFKQLPGTMPRVVSIGRLDSQTEGLILLTNDGVLASEYEKNSSEWEREYRIELEIPADSTLLAELQEGKVYTADSHKAFTITLLDTAQSLCSLKIKEDKSKEVRKTLAQHGLQVNKMVRVRFGPFNLENLAPGELLELNPLDV